jgi:hypothetical protein
MDGEYNKTVSISRLVASGSADTERYQIAINSVRCQIQPLDDSAVENIEGSAGKDFLMFSEYVDLKQEDKVVDGSTVYLVVGVEQYEWQGKKHTETRIRLPK